MIEQIVHHFDYSYTEEAWTIGVAVVSRNLFHLISSPVLGVKLWELGPKAQMFIDIKQTSTSARWTVAPL